MAARTGSLIPLIVVAHYSHAQCSWDICGYWYSDDYTCPFNVYHHEIFAISQTEDGLITCTKVIGDACVPAGHDSWTGQCSSFLVNGLIYGSFGPGQPIISESMTLEILSGDELFMYVRGFRFYRAGSEELAPYAEALAEFPLPCVECTAFFPNVFSPNGDGVNDLFLPLSSCVADPHLFRIHNRWGKVVYEVTDAQPKWDGRIGWENCPEGTYYWSLLLGTDQVDKIKHGMVTLLR